MSERALSAELTHRLGYEKHDPEGRGSGNSRNGKSRKKLKGEFGELELEVPRDREGEFEPKIVGKLALKNVVRGWQRHGVKHWRDALNQFAILWEDRIRAVTHD